MISLNGSMFISDTINDHQLPMHMFNLRELQLNKNSQMFITSIVLNNTYIWDKINSILHSAEKFKTSILISSQEAFQ